MFKYEDMDFQSLTTSLDIENPDGPEELYAMAQFCRMGKGTQASEENYRFYLQRAADAGSEQAKQELDALDNADAASAAEPPEEARAVEGMSLPELMQAADNGNPYALLPLAKKAMSSEFHDLPKAKQWLEKAAALAPQGVYSDEDATKIYITLGRLLKKPEFDTPENRAACHRYYSLAAELGSGEAFDELSDQYEKGYGCTADPEKAKLYAARGDNRNDPAIMIFRGIAKIQSSKNLMDLVADISRIRKASDDRDILAFADLLAAAAGFEPLKPETAQWAWDHEHGGDISIPIHTNAHFNGIPRRCAEFNNDLSRNDANACHGLRHRPGTSRTARTAGGRTQGGTVIILDAEAGRCPGMGNIWCRKERTAGYVYPCLQQGQRRLR